MKNYRNITFAFLLTGLLFAIWIFEKQSYLGIGFWSTDTDTDVIEKKLTSSREAASNTVTIIGSNLITSDSNDADMMEDPIQPDFALLKDVQERWVRLNKEPIEGEAPEELKQYQQLIDDVGVLEDEKHIDPLTALRIRLKSLSFILQGEEYLQTKKRLISEFNTRMDNAIENQQLAIEQSKDYRDHQIYKIKEGVLVDSIINEMEFDSNEQRDSYIGEQLKKLRLGRLDVPLD